VAPAGLRTEVLAGAKEILELYRATSL
jgi:hypothetical protein